MRIAIGSSLSIGMAVRVKDIFHFRKVWPASDHTDSLGFIDTTYTHPFPSPSEKLINDLCPGIHEFLLEYAKEVIQLHEIINRLHRNPGMEQLKLINALLK
jgi:hypothetical protein